ncbi:type I restriction endonuclease EcoAI subunit S [Verrucomicrobiota bacterium]|nr:type I restriction endonuclease EcoAI subunit S [Verrucomicrobiota bacterium]
MKLETFFEKFDQFADAPNAVAKMRELVLHLAFSGKLLPTAEPWPLKPLKSLATKIGSGATPAGGRESYFTEGIPLIRSMNVHFAGFEPKGLVFLSDEQAKQLANVTVQPGDVLLNITGASIGRVTTAPSEMAGARVNQHVAIIRPIKELDARFLAKFLASPAIQRMIDDVQVGATREALTKGMIEQFDIPLPPLAEQKRIVAKVDELMALCDRLEAHQQERETRHAALARASLARFADAPTPANLPFLFHPSYPIPPADLRKSILTLAVQGKLVPQDPNDEPAEDSLARNDERRRATAHSDHRADEENQPLLSADDRWDIAETWSWRGLADLVLFVDYRGKTPAKLSSGVRLLTAKNVRKGQINLSPEEFLSESEYHAWMTRGFPKAGDVLFTTEAPMGNAAVVELTERFALAQRVICFQSYGALEPPFLVLQILSDQFQFILDKNGTGVTAKGIKASKLKQLPITIPPLAEQRRIVAKVEQLMVLVDALETQLAASRATAANLLSALVAELTTPKTLLGLGMTNGRLSPTKP